MSMRPLFGHYTLALCPIWTEGWIFPQVGLRVLQTLQPSGCITVFLVPLPFFSSPKVSISKITFAHFCYRGDPILVDIHLSSGKLPIFKLKVAGLPHSYKAHVDWTNRLSEYC